MGITISGKTRRMIEIMAQAEECSLYFIVRDAVEARFRAAGYDFKEGGK